MESRLKKEGRSLFKNNSSRRTDATGSSSYKSKLNLSNKTPNRRERRMHLQNLGKDEWKSNHLIDEEDCPEENMNSYTKKNKNISTYQ